MYEDIFILLKETTKNESQLIEEKNQSQETNEFKVLEEKVQGLMIKKNRLVELLNYEKIQKIQTAVDHRMGPQLCENAEIESQEFKKHLQNVIKGYKYQKSRVVKKKKEECQKFKEYCDDKIIQLQRDIEKVSNNLQRSLCNVKEKIASQKQINQQQTEEESTEKIFYQLEDQIQMLLLQLSLKQQKQRNRLNNLISELNRII